MMGCNAHQTVYLNNMNTAAIANNVDKAYSNLRNAGATNIRDYWVGSRKYVECFIGDVTVVFRVTAKGCTVAEALAPNRVDGKRVAPVMTEAMHAEVVALRSIVNG